MTTKAALGRLATSIREELGLGTEDPFDPLAWADEWGVPFLSLDDVPDIDSARKRFTVEAPGAWSAALVQDGSRHLVIYNPSHSPERLRSDLAHEVAHFGAEHSLSSGWVSENGCGATNKEQEREAAELSGLLLIPQAEAMVWAIRSRSPYALAARYKVSVEMATWRMRMSGGAKIAERSRRKRAS